MSRKIKGIYLGLAAAAFFSMVQGAHAFAEEQGQEDNTLTIYLDKENQYTVRMAVAVYEHQRSTWWDPEVFPDITWNLVDKSALSREELQQLIWEELKRGEGPDLIFVDEESVDDPYKLMYGGYLQDLTEYMELVYEADAETAFAPSVLEGGAAGGSQYLIPIYVNTPLLLSETEKLTESGFVPEDISSLEELVEWAYEYQQETGGQAFDGDILLRQAVLLSGLTVLDYEKGTVQIDEEQFNRLYETCRMLEEIVPKTEGAESYFSAYENLSGEGSLFSAVPIEGIEKMTANLRVMRGAEIPVSYVQVPDLEGQVQTVITQAVGINKNSQKADLAAAALPAFLDSHTVPNLTGDGMPSVYERGLWQFSLQLTQGIGYATDFWPDCYQALIQEAEDPFSGAYNLAKPYEEAAKDPLTKAVFPTFLTASGGIVDEVIRQGIRQGKEAGQCLEELRDRISEIAEAEDGYERASEKEIDEPENAAAIQLAYVVEAAEEELPMGIWLEETAEGLADEGVQVNVFPMATQLVYMDWLEKAEVEPDILAVHGNLLSGGENPFMGDASPYIGEEEKFYTGALLAAKAGERLEGVPYAAKVSGLWYNKEVFREAGLGEDWQPADWEELEAGLAQLGEILPAQSPLLIQQGQAMMESFLRNAGGIVYDSGTKTAEVDRKACQAAAGWLLGLSKKGLAKSATLWEAASSLRDGQAAVFFGYSDLLKAYREDGSCPWEDFWEELGFLELPPMQEGIETCTVTEEYLFIISENCSDQEGTARVLEQYLAEESWREILQEESLFPTIRTEGTEEVPRLYQEAGASMERAVRRAYRNSSFAILLQGCMEGEKGEEELYQEFLTNLQDGVGQDAVTEKEGGMGE